MQEARTEERGAPPQENVRKERWSEIGRKRVLLWEMGKRMREGRSQRGEGGTDRKGKIGFAFLTLSTKVGGRGAVSGFH